jgi:hypothetical protein
MRMPRRMIVALFLLVPVVTHAMTWSSCQTITAISNYLAYSGTIYLSISPGISACSGNSGTTAVSAVGIVIGQVGVTQTNIDSFLATSLTAMAAGKQVSIYYNEATAPQCFTQIVAIGGWEAQCP